MKIIAYISPPNAINLENQKPVNLITDRLGASANLWQQLSFEEQSLLISMYLSDIGYSGWKVNRIIN